MRKTTKRLEELLIDITFAEEREFNSANEAFNKIVETIEDTFTAVAFAEEGVFVSAKDCINKDGEDNKPQNIHGQFTTLCPGRI